MKKKMIQPIEQTFYVACVFLLSVLGSSSAVYADTAALQGSEEMAFRTGLIPPTPQELEDMSKPDRRILKVYPNKIGLARIRDQVDPDVIMIPAKFLEGEFVYGGSPEIIGAVPILPSAVNNSALPSFPVIGDQGFQGSCVAFASTYYQASHEIALANGLNNKVSRVGVLSPKWTYNMINFGVDGGAYIQDAYELLTQNGAASIESWPYDGNYLSWDLNSQDWISAISNRLKAPKYLLVDSTPQNLTQIKQALANGHVLTFATYAYGWAHTAVKANDQTQNRFVGQRAISWVNSNTGPHMVTIVGYDDNVWVDVNGNGQVDAGEMGAFLVANSWGSSWGNQGFIWISYDAFLSQSAVSNGPSVGRVSAASLSNNLFIVAVAKTLNYKPSLIAQFSLRQTQRNQIKIACGVSSPSDRQPNRYFMSGALFYQGGSYGFDGRRGSPLLQSGTFALDLTDFAAANPATQRYYLMVVDNSINIPTILDSFSLINPATGAIIPDRGILPAVADKSKITHYIDASAGPQPAAEPLEAIFTAPPNDSIVQGTVVVTIKARSGSLSRMECYVDSLLVVADNSEPYFFLWDTTQVANGTHQLTTIAYDQSHQSVASTIRVKVKN